MDTAHMLADLSAGRFDFVDFGCSKGDSLKFGKKVLGGERGLGLDIRPEKVAATLAAGHEAMVFDATTLGDKYRRKVSFALLLHFLEHLLSYGDAVRSIRSAALAARDFVLIRQPWFDSDGFLMEQGCKLYWSDWHGHSNTMSTLSLQRALRDSRVPMSYRIYGRNRINSTSDRAVLPLETPMDQQTYDAAKHGPKPAPAPIPMRTYYETVAVILLSPRQSFVDITDALGLCEQIYASVERGAID